MATASTSPRGSKPWPMPAECSSPIQSTTRCATGCPLSSTIWASSRSRTLPGWCMSTGCDIVGAKSPLASLTLALPLLDKPSIAVLPFANLSGDPEQEYFVDGMVEEIITALSRIRWLFVIARNSSFSYKGQSPNVRQVGRELGVRYVLEGSVRKAGNRVRITGQLIDTTIGAHIWANRFDGTLDDIFELQDQVASSVVGAIEPKLPNPRSSAPGANQPRAWMPTTSTCVLSRSSTN